jgi:Uma2 family endonuclease
MPTATAQPVTYGHDAALARFSVASYQRMIETGILTAEDKVELLENYVVVKMPRNPRRDSAVQRILRPILKALPAGWDIRIQSAITLPDSQPEPDFAVVRGSASDYESRHPGAADIGLVIEVADSSLLRDQRDKTRIYARAGIPTYWIVNLVDKRIEIYSQPSGAVEVAGYGAFQTLQPGDTVPLILDGIAAGGRPAPLMRRHILFRRLDHYAVPGIFHDGPFVQSYLPVHSFRFPHNPQPSDRLGMTTWRQQTTKDRLRRPAMFAALRMAAKPRLRRRCGGRPIVRSNKISPAARLQNSSDAGQEIAWRRHGIKHIQGRNQAETARLERQGQRVAGPKIDAVAALKLDFEVAPVVNQPDPPAVVTDAAFEEHPVRKAEGRKVQVHAEHHFGQPLRKRECGPAHAAADVQYRSGGIPKKGEAMLDKPRDRSRARFPL